jgi:hypothetical protein
MYKFKSMLKTKNLVKNILFIYATIFSNLTINAQIFETGADIILESGNKTTILDEKQINIEYDYSDFGIGKFGSKDYTTEAEYVNSKVNALNNKKVGRGDEWKQRWISDRSNIYQKKFEASMNNILARVNQKYGDFPQSQYTLLVKTNTIELGGANRNTYIDVYLILVETKNHSNIIAKYFLTNAFGTQSVNMAYSIGGCYGKAGKVLAKELLKRNK